MKNKSKSTGSKGFESLKTRDLARCGERLKGTAEDGSRWKSILVNLLLEDDSKGFGSFETGDLARCGERLKRTAEDRSRWKSIIVNLLLEDDT